MISAADRTGAILGVGLFRRFLWSVQFARALIQEGVLGQIESFDFREGGIYDWPVASDFFFRKDAAGGGVLIDTGAHTLDCLLYMLGDFSEVEYFDDAAGGVEANCLIKLRLRDGIVGVVELSRTRKLRGTGIVRGTKGNLEIVLGWDRLLGCNHLKISLPKSPLRPRRSRWERKGGGTDAGFPSAYRRPNQRLYRRNSRMPLACRRWTVCQIINPTNRDLLSQSKNTGHALGRS